MFVEVKLIQTHRYHYIALSIPILFINRKSFFSQSRLLFFQAKNIHCSGCLESKHVIEIKVSRKWKKACRNVYLSEFAIEAPVDRLKWDIRNREQWVSFGLDEIESKQVDSSRSDGAHKQSKHEMGSLWLWLEKFATATAEWLSSLVLFVIFLLLFFANICYALFAFYCVALIGFQTLFKHSKIFDAERQPNVYFVNNTPWMPCMPSNYSILHLVGMNKAITFARQNT